MMAGKKKEVTFQLPVSNDEQWMEMLETDGLTVVDVFQKWCGPCRAVISLFQKIKNELGDVLLHFAIAEADSIEALKKYRRKCEPTFLFFGGGELVAVLRGVNAPHLQKMVVAELKKEKDVLEQDGERITITDDGLISEEEEEDEEDSYVPDTRCYTVAIIKPDVVAVGNTDEIITKIQDADFEILIQEERTLTESEVQEFYQHEATEPYFQDLITFMSSEPSHILVISKYDNPEDVILAWQEFLGPVDIEIAKKERPESLRAQYGTENPFNAFHGSRDSEEASRELAFFFPNFRLPEPVPVERTLALIRPDAARESREQILARIHEAGFIVDIQKEMTLTEEQVQQFYHKHRDEKHFPALITNMTSGPVLVLVLTKYKAVERWRMLLGPSDPTQAKQEEPNCLRAQFGGEREKERESESESESGESEFVNQFHGSNSVEEAEMEISFFFPVECTLAVIKPDTSEEHKEEILRKIRKRGFTISRKQEIVLIKEIAEEFYVEHREKPLLNQLVHYMCSGPCTMLILRKQNAVDDWRLMMGPTDPDEARKTAPTSLRARFGKDILMNAVYGSMSIQEAQENIYLIFGPEETEKNFPELKNTHKPRPSLIQ